MNKKAVKKSKTWVVYILQCRDASLYTGITNNIEKRFAAHNQGKGAKYTRSRRPVNLMMVSRKMEQSAAMRLEYRIKRQLPSKKISALEKYAAKKPKASSGIKKKIVSSKEKKIQNIAQHWQVRLKKIHDEIPIQGSPERSMFRIVIEDERGRYFVIEQVSLKSVERKKQIAVILDCLAENNLTLIHPYLTDENGDHIIRYRNNFWQLMPYLHGVELDREDYMYERWRGQALAGFLIDLRRKSGNLLRLHSRNVFSLKAYIYKLIGEIDLYNREIRNKIHGVADFLEKDFMPAYEKFPVAFCHGDYHPLNIIWSPRGMKSVIDWEFCGCKSEIYDAANLIGCVGVEDPQSLTGELVKSFIGDIRQAGQISRISWKYLLEYIVALRFAWLAEWLRKKDTDMISLELDYMRLLMDHKKGLQKAWL